MKEIIKIAKFIGNTIKNIIYRMLCKIIGYAQRKGLNSKKKVRIVLGVTCLLILNLNHQFSLVKNSGLHYEIDEYDNNEFVFGENLSCF